MPTYSFTLILNDDVEYTDELMDALFDAGCNDGTFGASQGVWFAGFDREARDLQTAISSAIHAVESVPPLHVIRVEIEEEAFAAL